MGNELERKQSRVDRTLKNPMTRRKFLLRSAGAAGGAVLGVYVAPTLTSVAIPRAYAQATPVGGSGCTPGYWRNHLSDWPAAYPTTTPFDAAEAGGVFDVPAAYKSNLGNGATLYDVVGLGGGCEKALGRHAVAALLNAADLGKGAFGLSEAEVIGIVNAALATEDCAEIEKKKDLLEDFNEQSCPLGGRMP